MGYREFQPHPTLRPYIDAYWVVRSEDRESVTHRIFPDGCIDIIVNLGDDFSTDSGEFVMKNESVYLVGTMTRFKDTVRQPGSFLLGIRFKPLGFPSFFRFDGLQEITEQTVQFDRRLVPEIHTFDSNTVPHLDKFFSERLSPRAQCLSGIVDAMKAKNGNVSIGKIAHDHFITSRKLERNFRQYIGISPKEYANFLRYQYASKLIMNNRGNRNLLDVALDAGYYDHAHLANEIRKYTGLAPSAL